MWQDAVLAQSVPLLWNLPGKPTVNRRISFNITSLVAEI